MLRRLLLGLVSTAALATSASVLVVALAFALYAVAEPHFGRAGAAATVAGAAALLMGLLGLLISVAARSRRPKTQPRALGGVAERAFNLVREKPWMALSAAVGAGFLAVRNPAYLGSAIRAFSMGARRPSANSRTSRTPHEPADAVASRGLSRCMRLLFNKGRLTWEGA